MQLDLFDSGRTRALVRLGGLLAARLRSLRAEELRQRRQARAHREWREVRAELCERVVGHDELLDQLALIVMLHRAGRATQRILLCGAPGTGKTHIARAIAEISRCAIHIQDAQTISESGWSSTSLEEIIEGWSRREAMGLASLARGVLVLDEVGKLRVPPEGHGNSLAKRRGAQSSLLPLLGVGTPVTVGQEGRQQLDTRHMLVILCEAFTDAPWRGRAPTPDELVRYGIISEVVDRLTDILYVPAQPRHLLARLYAHDPGGSIGAVRDLADQLGFQLVLEPGVFAYAARAVDHLGDAIGQRAGAHWIAAAARRALTGALRDGLSPGAAVRVTPDDLHIPQRRSPRSDGEDRGEGPGLTFHRS